MLFDFPSEEAALSTSFRYADRRFLWSCLQLFKDRIEFFGLSWRGRHRRTLRLGEVSAVQWHTGHEEVNLVLRLHSGERVPLHVKTAGLWKHRIEARIERPGDAPQEADGETELHRAAADS